MRQRHRSSPLLRDQQSAAHGNAIATARQSFPCALFGGSVMSASWWSYGRIVTVECWGADPRVRASARTWRAEHMHRPISELWVMLF